MPGSIMVVGRLQFAVTTRPVQPAGAYARSGSIGLDGSLCFRCPLRMSRLMEVHSMYSSLPSRMRFNNRSPSCIRAASANAENPSHGNSHLNAGKVRYKRVPRVKGVQVKELRVEDIRRPLGKTRANDQEKVKWLMESIAEIGLLEPIDVLEVDGIYYGFSGCHRYEAHQRLGYEYIKCNVRKANQETLRMHLA